MISALRSKTYGIQLASCSKALIVLIDLSNFWLTHVAVGRSWKLPHLSWLSTEIMIQYAQEIRPKLNPKLDIIANRQGWPIRQSQLLLGKFSPLHSTTKSSLTLL
jgi:hypothetical protein